MDQSSGETGNPVAKATASTTGKNNPKNSSAAGRWISLPGYSTDINDYSIVLVNGVLGDEKDFIEALKKYKGAAIGFFNPSQGIVKDLMECRAQQKGEDPNNLARDLAAGVNSVKQPMKLIAHSQGTLIVALAANKYGLPSGTTFDFRSPALNKSEAKAMLGSVHAQNLTYDMKWGDGANIWASTGNPLKFASGLYDFLTFFSVHTAEKNGLGNVK